MKSSAVSPKTPRDVNGCVSDFARISNISFSSVAMASFDVSLCATGTLSGVVSVFFSSKVICLVIVGLVFVNHPGGVVFEMLNICCEKRLLLILSNMRSAEITIAVLGSSGT